MSTSESKQAQARKQTVHTVWGMRTYDVWGNATDGYEVNDSYRRGDVELELEIVVNNAGSEYEFESAYPSDKQLREVFGLGKTRIETDGDDLSVYVSRERDGYPVGELRLESHPSLSPVREFTGWTSRAHCWTCGWNGSEFSSVKTEGMIDQDMEVERLIVTRSSETERATHKATTGHNEAMTYTVKF